MSAKGNAIQTKIQEAETCYLINSLFPDRNAYNTAIKSWDTWFPAHYIEVKNKPTDSTYDVSGLEDSAFDFLTGKWETSFYYQLTALDDFCRKNGWNLQTAKAYHWDTGNFAMKGTVENFVTTLGFSQKDNCFKADIVVFFNGTDPSGFSGNEGTYEDFRLWLLEQYKSKNILPVSLKQLSGRPLSHVAGLYGDAAAEPTAELLSFEAPIGVNKDLLANLDKTWNNTFAPSCSTTLYGSISGPGVTGKSVTKSIRLCIRTFDGVSSYPNITIATGNGTIDLGDNDTYKVTAVNLGKIGAWLNNQKGIIDVKRTKTPRAKFIDIQTMRIKSDFFPAGTIESNTANLTSQQLTNVTKFTPVPGWLDEFYDKMRTTAMMFDKNRVSLADLLVSCTVSPNNRKFVHAATEIDFELSKKIVEFLQQEPLCGVNLRTLSIKDSQTIVYNLSLICWHLIVMANIDAVFVKFSNAIDAYKKQFDLNDYNSAAKQYFVECYKAAAGEDTFSDKYKKLVDLCLYS